IDNPILPKGLVPSYRKISEAVVWGLNQLGIHAQIRNSKSEIRNPKSQLCFFYPTEYEIVVAGKKIVGSAQKRGRRALLQQGSIFVRRTTDEAFFVLKRWHGNVDAVSVEEVLGRKIAFEELSKALIEGFKERLGIRFNEE
ncbi:MAG: lipoate--protein ligase family protein, partial [Candidatus Margulisiibacteriota bacterium]